MENLQLEDVVESQTFASRNDNAIVSVSNAAASIAITPAPLTTTNIQNMTKSTYTHSNNNNNNINNRDTVTRREEQGECLESTHSRMEAEQNEELPSTTYKSPCCLAFPLPSVPMQSLAPTLSITSPLPASAATSNGIIDNKISIKSKYYYLPECFFMFAK